MTETRRLVSTLACPSLVVALLGGPLLVATLLAATLSVDALLVAPLLGGFLSLAATLLGVGLLGATFACPGLVVALLVPALLGGALLGEPLSGLTPTLVVSLDGLLACPLGGFLLVVALLVLALLADTLLVLALATGGVLLGTLRGHTCTLVLPLGTVGLASPLPACVKHRLLNVGGHGDTLARAAHGVALGTALLVGELTRPVLVTTTVHTRVGAGRARTLVPLVALLLDPGPEVALVATTASVEGLAPTSARADVLDCLYPSLAELLVALLALLRLRRPHAPKTWPGLRLRAVLLDRRA